MYNFCPLFTHRPWAELSKDRFWSFLLPSAGPSHNVSPENWTPALLSPDGSRSSGMVSGHTGKQLNVQCPDADGQTLPACPAPTGPLWTLFNWDSPPASGPEAQEGPSGWAVPTPQGETGCSHKQNMVLRTTQQCSALRRKDAPVRATARGTWETCC